jgi:hypothetical protein
VARVLPAAAKLGLPPPTSTPSALLKFISLGDHFYANTRGDAAMCHLSLLIFGACPSCPIYSEPCRRGPRRFYTMGISLTRQRITL